MTESGDANVNSLPYFIRHFSTTVPQEPLRPTSKTLGHDTAVGPMERKANERLVSNMRDSRTAADETCGLLDMQPSQVALGEGLLRRSKQRGESTLRPCKAAVKTKKGRNIWNS
jgi:hypothetical protein